MIKYPKTICLQRHTFQKSTPILFFSKSLIGINGDGRRCTLGVVYTFGADRLTRHIYIRLETQGKSRASHGDTFACSEALPRICRRKERQVQKYILPLRCTASHPRLFLTASRQTKNQLQLSSTN